LIYQLSLEHGKPKIIKIMRVEDSFRIAFCGGKKYHYSLPLYDQQMNIWPLIRDCIANSFKILSSSSNQHIIKPAHHQI